MKCAKAKYTNFDVREAHRDTVLSMLRREDALRKSDSIQHLYDKLAHLSGEQVELYVQKKVLQEHGFWPNNANLEKYWEIHGAYKDDEEVMSSVIYLKYAHLYQECDLPLGCVAPDAPLLSFDGSSQLSLYSLVQQGKPLVVLAGSLTCPPFRDSIQNYIESYERNKDRFTFVTIYIMEAHFVEEEVDPDSGETKLEGWPIGFRWRIPQHKCLEDRVAMAKRFVDLYDYPIPTYLDTMDNDFNQAYHPWPDGAYVIHQGKLLYKSSLQDGGIRDCPWTTDIENLLKKPSQD